MNRKDACEQKNIDWEQHKWELVCHIAQGMYGGRACHHALEAVQCAEDIIATYKERMQDCKKGGGERKQVNLML